jgi:hypothetical protein
MYGSCIKPAMAMAATSPVKLSMMIQLMPAGNKELIKIKDFGER